jgi:RNA polymerase sigma-70 factor (ECF subfamily)
MTRGEEKILVSKSLAGDNAAYAALIGAFSAPVFSLLLRLLGNNSDAEDAAQDVFLRAYKPKFQGIFGTYSILFEYLKTELPLFPS